MNIDALERSYFHCNSGFFKCLFGKHIEEHPESEGYSGPSHYGGTATNQNGIALMGDFRQTPHTIQKRKDLE